MLRHALEYLQSIDIVYCDLKTENVMLLIVFGLSKLNMNEGALTNTFSGTGMSFFFTAIQSGLKDSFFLSQSTFLFLQSFSTFSHNY